MGRRIALIAAITVVALGAGTSIHMINDAGVARDLSSSLTSARSESSRITVAMLADEGVPQNLVTRKR